MGTAPAFLVERQDRTIIAVPGVPREMEYLMQKAVLPYLREHYQIKGVIKARVVHTAGAGESQIDDLIGDLEALSNPTVGLAAHSGQVDVRITAKAESEAAADALILSIEEMIRERLGTWIYGYDQESLEGAAMVALNRKGWTLAVVESGLNGLLIRRLAGVEGPFLGGEMLTERPSPQELMECTQILRQSRGADAALGVSIYPQEELQEIHLALITPDGTQQLTRPYGGPPEYAARWAFHHSLDVIRHL